MLIKYILIALCSLLLGIIFVSLLRKFSSRHKVLIYKEVPFIGGIAIGLSFVLTSSVNFLFSADFPKQAMGIIISSFVMLAFGVIDDWKELSISAKFIVQIIATSLLIFFGIRTQIVYIGNLGNIIITFIWVLGISNAFNHLDVVDGVASGTALIVALALFGISILNADILNVILTLALIGAVAGFLFYNLPPARIYMGNSGSHFLGFVLAAICLAISYAPIDRAVALFSPLLILGLPIFDTAFLILMRLKQGRSVLKKSEDHLALRFLKLGYSKKKTLFIMLAVALFFSSFGVLLIRVPNMLGIAIIVFVVLASLGLAKKMSKVLI